MQPIAEIWNSSDYLSITVRNWTTRPSIASRRCLLAVISGHKEIVRILVEAGANLELKGGKPFGCTPLEYAERHGLDEFAGILRGHA